MSEAATIVDPSTDLRDWLRGQAVAGLAARVYIDGFPKGVTLPACAFSRIGGPIVSPIDQGLYAFEVRAATAPAVKAAAYALVSLLESTGRTDLGDVVFCGATTAALNSIADPDDPSVHRMTATVQITTKHSP